MVIRLKQRQQMSEDEWLLCNGCKTCGVWASDRSCDCDYFFPEEEE